jgi:hypothetical protein
VYLYKGRKVVIRWKLKSENKSYLAIRSVGIRFAK